MEFNEKAPIWLQIYEHMCRRIASGQWAEGQRIPSVRETAVDYQVNPNTVMRAYERLTQEEAIFNRRGIGYFTAPGAKNRTLESLREEFRQAQLHELFARMEELGIDIEEVRNEYNRFKQHNNHEIK